MRDKIKKFRLPRKIKKKIANKIFLYPKDSREGMLMAWPLLNQEDYDAVKNGIAKDIFHKTKAQVKTESIKWKETYHQPVEVDDETLSKMVDEVFSAEYRKSALSMLKRAKFHPIAIEDYYTFINSYNLGKTNISAMCYDGLKMNLKKSKKNNFLQ